MRYGHAATALFVLAATTGGVRGEAAADDVPTPAFSAHAPFFVRPCTCRHERWREVLFGLRYTPGPRPAVEFNTDDGHTFQFRIEDAKLVDGNYVFRIPQRYEGGGVYRLHVTRRGAEGTWIHELDSGATVIEPVHWSITQIVA